MIDLGQYETAAERRERFSRRRPATVPDDERQSLCAESLARCRSDNPMTLDGRPATISGAFQSFATVRDDDGRAYQWAWINVRRIVAAGGHFKA